MGFLCFSGVNYWFYCVFLLFMMGFIVYCWCSLWVLLCIVVVYCEFYTHAIYIILQLLSVLFYYSFFSLILSSIFTVSPQDTACK